MIFEKEHTNVKIWSDEKVSAGRKIMIGLLATAVICGGVNGYMQQKTTVKSDAEKIGNMRSAEAVRQHVKE